MFQNLSDRLNQVFKKITGQGRLTEDNIQDTLREVRIALLEADVALGVVKDFCNEVKEEALGQTVMESLNPGQAFIKIVHEHLVKLMGESNEALNLNCQPPAVILMAGLQGSGKTTTSAKLAKQLIEKEKKSVLMVSCDIYRPAAIKQLETVAGQVGADYLPSDSSEKVLDIVDRALQAAKQKHADVLIIDTAGRLHVDAEMMAEITSIHQHAKPVETLFVIDSMTGQDAVQTAKAFNEALALTGVILTKLDGDARGGAALSVRKVTGCPIKYIGVGEKLEALESFHPDRIASRILGMGDMLSLIEDLEAKVDKKKADKLAKKLKKGKGFDLEDFREQMQQMSKLGGLTGMLDKIPGLGQVPQAAKEKVNDKVFVRLIAIINSMTPKERRFPDLIKGSRKRRIALGSGTTIQEVNQLLKQFKQMQKMMKRFSKKGGMQQMMQAMGGPGGMPGMGAGGMPGMPPGGLPKDLF